jgi:prolipoprotein diacylglyceryltransferase
MKGIPLHPTQLYSAMGNFALFFLLNGLALCDLRPGTLAALYLIVGSTGRFLVEFIRWTSTKRFLGLTMYQVVTLELILAGFALLWLVSYRSVAGVFSDTGILLKSLSLPARQWLYPLWFFIVLFVAFGIHGRRVGKV